MDDVVLRMDREVRWMRNARCTSLESGLRVRFKASDRCCTAARPRMGQRGINRNQRPMRRGAEMTPTHPASNARQDEGTVV